MRSKDIVQRANEMTQKILSDHRPEPLPTDIENDLKNVTRKIMKRHEIDNLPLGPTGVS